MKKLGTTEQLRTWVQPELRRKMNRRMAQLGIPTESAYLRRLIENACAGIPSEPDPEV